MFYPEDSCLGYWTIFMTLVLLTTCFVTPWKIAFSDEADYNWEIINTIIDFCFAIDMVIIFNTAFYDEEN